ncbi:MAG: hydrolase, HAD-superfamily, subfamily [Segetibacter sp.]|nr:hydrolase, HAD-superfamily, subfamily [Segetibacter sp.]
MSVLKEKVVFIDKDGTLIPDIPYNIDPGKISLSEGVLQGLQLLKERGYKFVMVSNQSGVARGYFTLDALKAVQEKIETLVSTAGIHFEQFYFCPHHPEGTVEEYAIECSCRKPMPGMLLQAAEELNIDVTSSWMIGDILNDVEAGKSAGCKTILIDNGNETEWQVDDKRSPDFIVKTFLEAANCISEYSSYKIETV